MNLTDITAYVDAINVTRLRTGWAIVTVVSVVTGYESGAHGDRTIEVGYFVNTTKVRRVRFDGETIEIGPHSGTILLDCNT